MHYDKWYAMTNRFLFTIQPQSGIPLYRQIVDQVRGQVAGGRLAAGELLPSVRQLASDLQINMMTVSKAYSLLESDGVLTGCALAIAQTGTIVLNGGPAQGRRDHCRPAPAGGRAVRARSRGSAGCG